MQLYIAIIVLLRVIAGMFSNLCYCTEVVFISLKEKHGKGWWLIENSHFDTNGWSLWASGSELRVGNRRAATGRWSWAVRMEPGGHFCTEPYPLGHRGLVTQPDDICPTTQGHGKDTEFCSTSAGLRGRIEPNCALWTLHSGCRGPAPTCRSPTPPSEAVLRTAQETEQGFQGPFIKAFGSGHFCWWAPSEDNSLLIGPEGHGADGMPKNLPYPWARWWQEEVLPLSRGKASKIIG